MHRIDQTKSWRPEARAARAATTNQVVGKGAPSGADILVTTVLETLLVMTMSETTPDNTRSLR